MVEFATTERKNDTIYPCLVLWMTKYSSDYLKAVFRAKNPIQCEEVKKWVLIGQ